MIISKKSSIGFLFFSAVTLSAIDPLGVAVSEKASAVEKKAAAELIRYLDTITGEKFRTVSVGDARFLVGSEFIRDPSLGNDGLAVKTRDGQILIGGGTPAGRGNYHAVYEYLEQCGVRFWTGDEEDIPKIAAGKLPEVNTRQTPSFPLIRYVISSFAPPAYPKWKLNGCCSGYWTKGLGSQSLRNPEEGIVYDFQPYNWHTLLFMLPQEKYGKAHPEWYSLYNGKREWNIPRAQLCFTNEAMTKEFIANCREYLKQHGGPNTILGISKEDRQLVNCECANCSKVDAAAGKGHAGAYLLFLNRIAKELEKDYPDMRIQGECFGTLGDPPTSSIVMHRNIILDISFGGTDLAGNLRDFPENRDYLERLKKWTKVTPGGLTVCDYGSTFDNYLYPFPNFDGLAERLRDWRDNHVIGMTTINAHSTGGGELHDIRNYLTAKLYWNCDLDPWKVVKDFCDGFYKAAGKHVYDYVKWYHRNLREEKKFTFIMGHNPGYAYDRKYVDTAIAYFQKAYAAAGNDPVLKKRLDYAYLSIRFLDLQVRQSAGEISKKFDDDVQTFEKECARFKITWLSEQLPLTEYLAGLKLKVPTPDFCKRLKRSDWFVHTPNCYPYWGWCEVVDDPTSPTKKPVKLNTNHVSWAIYKRCDVLPGAVLSAGHYDAYAYLKPELARPGVPAQTPICKFGWIEGNNLKQNRVTLEKLPAGKYGYVKIAENFPVTLDGQVWIAPLNNPEDIKAIYVDHLVFVRRD